MQPSAWMPYLLFSLALLALLAAVWFAVRRPPPGGRSRLRPAWWHTVQACLAALTATLGALCVLGGVALLN